MAASYYYLCLLHTEPNQANITEDVDSQKWKSTGRGNFRNVYSACTWLCPQTTKVGLRARKVQYGQKIVLE